MNTIFSKAGLDSLHAFLSAGALVAFDLDGTLAAIHAEPHKIHISAEIQHELQLLMRYVPIAVITGRSRSDAMRFLDISPTYLIGNHGAEGLEHWKSAEKQFRDMCQSWKMQVLQQLETSDTGIMLEDKGASLSVHYRHAPAGEQTDTRLHHILNSLFPPPRVIAGKFVLNLVPHEAPNKGDALLELMAQSNREHAVFVGDDTTDEDVFALGAKNILSVRVGESETSKADWFVAEQSDILSLLKEARSYSARRQAG